MFYLDEPNPELCCGCSACVQICPLDCISMSEDDEGFLYPIKNNEICNECGLCARVCPMAVEVSASGSRSRAFCAIHMDHKELNGSASGAAFPAIMNAWCKDDFIIFGAMFDKNFSVVHGHSFTIENAERFRKSKYVQSNINTSFKDVKKFLRMGKRVLFTGTPCQNAGLKTFLGHDYEKLLCVDLVCHGVPSQRIFNLYIDLLERKYMSPIENISFRHKTKTGKGWNSRNVRALMQSGQEIIQSVNENPYLMAYHNALFYRKSCTSCKFANPARVADITIADFWGIDKLRPDIDVHKGASLLLINSIKGQRLLDDLKKSMDIFPVDLEFAIETNGQLRESARAHPRRQQFFDMIDGGKRFDEAVYSCIPHPSVIRKLASRWLSADSKTRIKRLLRM